MDLRYDELALLAEVHDPFSEKGRRAVAGPNSVSFGIGRMYQMILNTPEFQGFRSHREALDWLGLDGVTLKGVYSAAYVQDVLEENPVATAPSDPSPVRLTRKRFKRGDWKTRVLRKPARGKTNLETAVETAVEFLLRLRRPGLSRVDHWLRPKPAKMAPFITGPDTRCP